MKTITIEEVKAKLDAGEKINLFENRKTFKAYKIKEI